MFLSTRIELKIAVSTIYPEFVFVLKTKSHLDYLKNKIDKPNYELLTKLIYSENIVYANKYNVNAEDLVGISDLIVS